MDNQLEICKRFKYIIQYAHPAKPDEWWGACRFDSAEKAYGWCEKFEASPGNKLRYRIWDDEHASVIRPAKPEIPEKGGK